MNVTLFNLINKFKNPTLNSIIFVIALSFSLNIYKIQGIKIAALKERKDAEIKKNKILEEIDQLQNNIGNLKAVINKKDISLIVDKLKDFATGSSIKIITFKPEGQRDYPAYIKYFFSLNITSSNYHNLAKFINKLESSADIYIIESIDISSQATKQDKADNLIAQLRLSTILVKD